MTTIRLTSAVLLVTLLVSTACGNLAVPPPFEEARNGWDIETGDRVEIVVKGGQRMVGVVEEVAPAGFRVSGEWVAREDIASMKLVRDRWPVWKIVAVTGAVAWGVVAIYLAARDHEPVERPVRRLDSQTSPGK